MKRMYKLALLMLFTLFFASLFLGCARSRELNELVIVSGLGIDVDAEEPGNVKLISQIVLPSKIKSGEESKAFFNAISTGTNTFEAVRRYTHFVTGKLYLSHNQVIVIGRRRAEQGIARSLDFFVRAKETRPSVKLFVADTTAEDVLSLEVPSNDMPAMLLSNLIDATEQYNGEAFVVDLVDYLQAMQSPSQSLLVPIVCITENAGEQVHEIRGMAVFKQDRMVGELSDAQVRGLAWATNRVKSCVISVEVGDGSAALEVIEANGKMKTEPSEDGKIEAKISVSVQLRLSEQTCVEDLSTPEHLDELEALVAQEIAEDILRAFERSADLGADIFGFIQQIRRHNNKLWKALGPDYEQALQMIVPKIDVQARIIAVGSLEEPVWASTETQ